MNKSWKRESTNSEKREGTTEIRKMTVGSYDNNLRKKLNRKAEERERKF